MEPRATGRAGGGLVLSDGPCPVPGSLGSRGPASQPASPKPLGSREPVCIEGSGEDKSGGWKKLTETIF